MKRGKEGRKEGKRGRKEGKRGRKEGRTVVSAVSMAG
jgi:hypothetical protein